MKTRVIHKLTIFIGSLFFVISANAAMKELVFATPPTQSPEVTLKNYQPLVDYLMQATGEKIVIHPAKNFQEYTKRMRAGEYDLVFDGPHFIKWRIDKQKNSVLAKQPGRLHFVVVAKKDSPIKNLKDLWAKSVCAISVPHLSTLTLLEEFNNPIREPNIIPIKSFKDGMECLDSDRGNAVLLRDKYWQKKVKDKSKYRVVHVTTKEMPARGLTAAETVSKKAQQMITKALTDKAAKEYTEKAFSSIGGGKFVSASTKEYDDLGELIKVVWGFHL